MTTPRDGPIAQGDDNVEEGGRTERTVEKLLRQQAALAEFGSFAFRETDLHKIITEAARICAVSLDVPFCKICRYRPDQDDLLIEAGWGWTVGVVGRVVSQADESSPQGRAYVTGKPVIIRNIMTANNLALPPFYEEHNVISTVDVLIPAVDGASYGVLEIDSTRQHQYDQHDINFLTGFANVLAEAVATAGRVKTLQQALEAKDLLAEELQHRVRNNLQMVGGMLETYARRLPSRDSRDGIEQIVRRLATMAQVYDSLLGVGLAESIDAGDYLQRLCRGLPQLQPGRSEPVRIVCDADTLVLGIDTVMALGMAAVELVTNSFKHAFPDRAGTVTLTLRRLNPTRASLELRDDGVGFAIDPASPRHGISLVRRMVAGIGGTLTHANVGGSVWTLEFPLPDAAAPGALPGGHDRSPDEKPIGRPAH